MIEVKKEGVLLKKTKADFENEGVLNPAAFREGDYVHLFYRKEKFRPATWHQATVLLNFSYRIILFFKISILGFDEDLYSHLYHVKESGIYFCWLIHRCRN